MKHLAWILLAAAVLPVACSYPKDLSLADIWFPSMSIRSSRPVVLYNRFSD